MEKMKTKISAEVVADSTNPQGHRITTFLLTYPRFIHSELMTHRMFSRNSASSRAIPFEKMLKIVEEDPFIPIAWQKNHKGMQGSEYWTDNDTVIVDEGDEYERYTKIYSATEHFITEWLEARDSAVAQSYELNRLGVTKQLCNRLLEPFMWHTVLVTATEFDNFFELRCPQYNIGDGSLHKSKKDAIKYIQSKGIDTEIGELFILKELDWIKSSESQAEIHMQALAEAMWDAMNESTPKELKAGEYHIPFGDKVTIKDLENLQYELSDIPNVAYDLSTDGIRLITGKKGALAFNNAMMKHFGIDPFQKLRLKIATARCARLSYMTFDGEIDYEKDLKLHDTLLESHHMSPFEHCARAMSDEEYESFRKGKHEVTLMDNTENQYWFIEDDSGEKGWCDNFKGFIPYRYLIENKQEI